MDYQIAQVSGIKRFVVRYESIKIASSFPLLGVYPSFFLIKKRSVASSTLTMDPM